MILSSTPLIASGGMNENIAEFDFCPLWDGFAKTAIFYRDETEKYYAIVNSENKCVIPWEVLQSDGKVFFGVYGVKGDIRRTTEILGYKIKLGAFDEKLKPSEPTPDIYSQYVNRIIEVENRVTPIEEFTIKPTPFELTGNPIQMQNFEGMPLKVVTAFEPIQSGSGDPSPDNVRPISGYEALELTRCGKNLLNNVAESQTVNGLTITKNADGTMLVNGVTTLYNTFVNLTSASATVCAIPPGKYIVSSGSPLVGVVVICDSNILAEAYAEEAYFEIPETAINSWARLQVWEEGVTINNETVYPMIRLAAIEDDSYEPYQSEVYSVQIGQTVYGGRMDWDSGVLTAEWANVALTGNESISRDLSVNGNDYARFNIFNITPGIIRASGANLNVVCSHYKTLGTPISNNNVNAVITGYANSSTLYVRDDAHASVAAYKEYLAAQYAAGTPIQVSYKLAEPITIQLTPNDIAALDGVNNIYGDGEITVSGRKDILWLTSGLIERIKTLEEAVVSLGGNV